MVCVVLLCLHRKIKEVLHFYDKIQKNKCFYKKDYPSQKIERLSFEDKLKAAIENKQLMAEKIDRIKNRISKGENITIKYLEFRRGELIITDREIKPQHVITGAELDKIYPLEFGKRLAEKFYVSGHCYLRNEKREFRIENIDC